MELQPPRVYFDGTKDADVEEFLFMYDNVVMRGKSDEEKAATLFAYLEGDAKSAYRSKFISGWSLSEEGKDYTVVCSWLIEQFRKELDPDEQIRIAMEARLDFSDLLKSLATLDALYNKAGFNDKAKYGMLKRAATGNSRLADYLVIKGPSTYDSLKLVIREFVRNCEAFEQVNIGAMRNPVAIGNDFSGSRPATSAAAVEYVREGVKEVESRLDNRLDMLTSQLENLTLTIKKTQAEAYRPPDICAYCKKPGHYANTCEVNPHRNTRCQKCGRVGHHESTCWKKGPFRKPNAILPASESAVEIKLRNDSKNSQRGEDVSVVEEVGDVMTTKRDIEGNVLSKRFKTGEENNNCKPSPESLKIKPDTHPKKGQVKTSKSRRKKPAGIKEAVNYVQKYDLLAELAMAPSGLTFGQLLRGDADDARKELKRLVKNNARKKIIAGPVVTPARRLKVVAITVQGFRTQALFDSGAVPNLISRNLADKLDLKIRPTAKRITVANGDTSSCVGSVEDVSVEFGQHKVPLAFLVMQGLPFNVIIGCPTMESLDTCIDLGNRMIKLLIEGEEVELQMDFDYQRTPAELTGTDSEDFTSDSGNETSTSEEYVAFAPNLTPEERELLDFVPSLSDEYEVLPTMTVQLSDQGEDLPIADADESSGADPGTPTDTVEHQNDISPFEESVEDINAELPSSGSTGTTDSVEATNYLSLLVEGIPLDEHLRPMQNERNERSRLAWQMVHISLGFYHVIAIGGSMFVNHDSFDELMAIYELFDDRLTAQLEERFFFFFYHTVVGRYGHTDTDLTYANEIQFVRESLAEGVPQQFNIVPDPHRNAVAYPFDLGTTEDEEDDAPEDEHEGIVLAVTEESGLNKDDGPQGQGQFDLVGPAMQPSTVLDENDEIETIRASLCHLPDKHADVIASSLAKNVVAWSLHDLRQADVPVRHSFKLTDYTPIYHKVRRQPPKWNEVIREEVATMLAGGIITPCSSPWSFPVVIATKKDGKPRFCVDFRLLNKVTVADRFPLPNIEEILEELKGSTCFTSLDLFSGYWQIPLDEDIKDITTFSCKFGTYRFEVMPFGLINAPPTFQRMMNELLGDLGFVRAYLDDVVIFSRTMTEHLGHVQVVLERISRANLKLKIKKCSFAQNSLKLLGHIVSEAGIKVDPQKTKQVADAPEPTSKTELRSFLGLASYYRRFIKDFAKIASCLHAATTPKGSFAWTEDMRAAFGELKRKLCEPPVLAYPDFTKPFIVETDASSYSVGAVLSQRDQNGNIHPVQYASRTMNDAEKNTQFASKKR